MDYVRTVDFDQLATGEGRNIQRLFDATSGATTCKIIVSHAPEGSRSPRGVHTHTFDQILYMLSGTLCVEIDGEQHTVGAGQLVIQPAGIPHVNWTPGPEPATFLEFMTPLPAFGETRESEKSYVDSSGNWVHPGSTPAR